MSKWLRRQTQNLLGFACVGSNLAIDKIYYFDVWNLISQNDVNSHFDIRFHLPLLHFQIQKHNIFMKLQRFSKWKNIFFLLGRKHLNLWKKAFISFLATKWRATKFYLCSQLQTLVDGFENTKPNVSNLQSQVFRGGHNGDDSSEEHCWHGSLCLFVGV